MNVSFYDYCVERGQAALLRQWDREKNAPLTPETVSHGSHQRVWWRCEKGHEWQTAVYHRGEGKGCPYCAGRQVLPGENDLASRMPRLAAQWHPTKNGRLTPEQVFCGSHEKVWWRCERGHVWQARIKARVQGDGCPVCAGKVLRPGEHDLATTHPELAAQWHPTRNGTLTPSGIGAGTRRKVWWVCEKGHEWQAPVMARARGTGCPVCAGRVILPGVNDLASRFPAISAQWHPTKNGRMRPDRISPGSGERVWWRCPLGHDYQARVSARTAGGSDCPYCAGRKVLKGFNDLATVSPRLAAQWHPTLNGVLTPEMVTAGSHRKVWWQCAEGHVWKAVIYSRTGGRKSGCPVCAGTVRQRPAMEA